MPSCTEPAISRRISPFMVVGRVREQERAARAETPAEALDAMLAWLDEDDDAAAVWYLREDWPAPVTLVGRPAPGLIGEVRRTAHLFPLEPGAVLYGSVTARCGAELYLQEIEWLSVGQGMPCECCLALSDTRPRLEGLPR
ncbi:hypothetical protein HFP15_20885 [Amycolatopsis sp. K13G38]|uniref:Uncharacterized protein n=2 Tax=Amycolatopsis acididurans TaxID=2724524 RepID=A0ABX1JAH3_9PSEU|nr:hypothetical protein [Amycolatopsis acididurans]